MRATALTGVLAGALLLACTGCGDHGQTELTEKAAMRAEDAARRAETAAGRVEKAAQRAEAAADKAERAMQYSSR